jgi:hypothetical protein
MEAYELFDKYMDKNFRSFEGERGVRNLEQLVETLGYGEGWMRGRAIEDFLTDNPGAVQAVVEFIGEWVERNSDWQDRLTDGVDEEEDE